jgi:hypothetical protein
MLNTALLIGLILLVIIVFALVSIDRSLARITAALPHLTRGDEVEAIGKAIGGAVSEIHSELSDIRGALSDLYRFSNFEMVAKDVSEALTPQISKVAERVDIAAFEVCAEVKDLITEVQNLRYEVNPPPPEDF